MAWPRITQTSGVAADNAWEAAQTIPVDPDLLHIPAGPGALHVERYGHGGHPVVLLHGFGTSAFLWRAVAPELSSAGYSAYAVDLLGYGESDRPPEADFSLLAQAEYVNRALMALRVSRATVVGVDMGAVVAHRLALLREERVERLVLINSPWLDEGPDAGVRAVQRGSARFALRLARGVLGATPLLRQVLEKGVADPAHMPPRLLARYLAPFVGADGVAHLLTLARALLSEDVSEVALDAVRVPTLVVWGEADAWLDSSLAERQQSSLPESRLVLLPGVGRLVPEEAPETLADLLMDFMRTTGR